MVEEGRCKGRVGFKGEVQVLEKDDRLWKMDDSGY